mmetsp:Transcript_15926/g.23278  ORF Transcript_15926/g.23278 Transcript_15926/m.23278 type:complete len:109 (-) Transcript_15926:486-812(-)
MAKSARKLVDVLHGRGLRLHRPHHNYSRRMDAAMAASEVFLHIDAYKVDQVIRTLLTNAVKWTGSGGSVEVKISCRLQDPSNANRIASKCGVMPDGRGGGGPASRGGD